MQEPGCYENYPTLMVIGSNLLSVLIWGIGAFLLYQFSFFWVIGYVLFILLLEFRLLGSHCVDCYYYGKTCAFGKGRLSALFFPRGIPDNFCHMNITWKDIIPDFLVLGIPVLAGILLLIQKFSLPVLILIIALLLLGFSGNDFVRGHLACSNCKQKEIGCPAERLFENQKK
jgi:hypothetical protein